MSSSPVPRDDASSQRRPGAAGDGLRGALPGIALQFLAVAMVAVVAAVGLVGWRTYEHERDRLVANAEQSMAAVNAIQRARISAHVDGLRQAVTLMTSRTQLRRSFVDVLAGDVDARDLTEQILADAVAATDGLLDAELLDAEGRVLATTVPAERGIDRGADADVAAATADVWVGGLALDGDHLVHRIGGPVTLDGVVLGMAMLSISAEPLVALVNDYTGLGDTGETILGLIDADGRALFAAPLRFDPTAALQRAVPDAVPMIDALAGREVTNSTLTDYRGEPVVSATGRVPEVGWGVVTKVDTAEVFLPLAELRRVLVLAGLAATLLAALLAVVAARRLVRPVRTLTAAATELAAGDRTSRAPVDGTAELRELARAFNTMVDTVTATESRLEAEVAARTDELSTAIGQLAERSDDLEALTSVLAHDLKNPLTIAVGLVEVLQVHDLGEEARATMLARVDAALSRIHAIINDVVRLVSAEHLEPQPRPTDLAALCADVLDELEAPQGLASVLGRAVATTDPSLLRPVLRNLIGNALKYAHPDRQLQVTVILGTTDGTARVAVQDNGVGIAPEDRPHLFEPFRRGSRTRATSGSGLGLAISRRLVQRLGGTVTYAPRGSGGSVFSVSLPTSPAAGTSPAHGGAQPASQPVTPPSSVQAG